MANIKTLLADVSAAAKSKGGLVEYGYGQVEPNHLSAQRTGQIYAQLPAHKDITVLEQGQFVKYDYADGVVAIGNESTGATNAKGEWMLVYNETKLYRDEQNDCEFAMIKDNYGAKIYSPVGDNQKDVAMRGDYSDIIAADDIRVFDYETDPFHVYTAGSPVAMPTGTKMVPRVFKTNVGDIFTTNMVKATAEALTVGKILVPGTDGILAIKSSPAATDMQWQVVKNYTLPDGQKAVKIMRIA